MKVVDLPVTKDRFEEEVTVVLTQREIHYIVDLLTVSDPVGSGWECADYGLDDNGALDAFDEQLHREFLAARLY